DLTDPDVQGEWRLIYASPSGQLTGSVRYHTLQEMALMQGLSAAQNNAMSAMAAANGAGGAQSAGATGAGAGVVPGAAGQISSQMGQPGQLGSSQGSAFAPTPISSGPVFGGYLVGVGCQLKRPSLIWYKGGKTYEQWEFIWNPLTVAAIATPGTGAIPGL